MRDFPDFQGRHLESFWLAFLAYLGSFPLRSQNCQAFFSCIASKITVIRFWPHPVQAHQFLLAHPGEVLQPCQPRGCQRPARRVADGKCVQFTHSFRLSPVDSLSVRSNVPNPNGQINFPSMFMYYKMDSFPPNIQFKFKWMMAGIEPVPVPRGTISYIPFNQSTIQLINHVIVKAWILFPFNPAAPPSIPPAAWWLPPSRWQLPPGWRSFPQAGMPPMRLLRSQPRSMSPSPPPPVWAGMPSRYIMMLPRKPSPPSTAPGARRARSRSNAWRGRGSRISSLPTTPITSPYREPAACGAISPPGWANFRLPPRLPPPSAWQRRASRLPQSPHISGSGRLRANWRRL